MGLKTLRSCQSKIFTYQQTVRKSKSIKQGNLFPVSIPHIDTGLISLFSLPLFSLSFFLLPLNNPGQVCIYFVIDSKSELFLYIGGTCKSNHPWKGMHDCKRYIEK